MHALGGGGGVILSRPVSSSFQVACRTGGLGGAAARKAIICHIR